MKKFPDLVATMMAFTDSEQVVLIYKPLVAFAGSLEGGIMLCQLLYWTPRATIEGDWIAKTDAEFAEELCLTVYAVRKQREQLGQMGILETKVCKFNGTPTVHYRLKTDVLYERWAHWISRSEFAKPKPDSLDSQPDSANTNSPSSTETTAETTTESFAQEREKCPKCNKPYSTGKEAKQTKDVCRCAQEEELDGAFGPSTPREVTEPPGHWSDRAEEPWMLEYGDVRPRQGISAASLKRVRWLIEQHTSLRPTDKQLKGWWAACEGIYESGRGDWQTIEDGIKRAWEREPKYRPRHPNGFVGEVQVAYGDIDAPQTRRKYLTQKPDGTPVFEVHNTDGTVVYEPYQ